MSVDAVAYQCPLEDGLSKKQLQELLSIIPANKDLTCFCVQNNNTTAIGFISLEAMEEKGLVEDDIKKFEEKNRYSHRDCLYRPRTLR